MPWCEDCSKYLTPSSLQADGTCPSCGRPVGEMNVTGNLRNLFSRLELTGDDVYPYSTTLSPSLVFSDVDFSGS